MVSCIAALLAGCASPDEGGDPLEGDESSDIDSDELDRDSPADGLTCNERGECDYESIEQLAAELLEIFPAEGVIYAGKRKGSLATCTVARDFLTGDNISKPFQRIRLETAGDTMEFAPYDEGSYPTKRIYRKASDSGVTFVDVRSGGVSYEMTIGYAESGALSAVAINAYGDGGWLKGLTCRDLHLVVPL